MDQKIRFENTFRTIFLYPFALSFIVTGLVWQWLLNPEFGIQSVVRSMGWESFTFDPLYNSQIVIYGILIAALWQGTGLGFLGLGAQPPLPEWGAMIATGRRYMLDSWWLVTFPGVAIFSICFRWIGGISLNTRTSISPI